MHTKKLFCAISTKVISLIFALVLINNCVYAADSVATSALDEIGQQYELNSVGDVFLTYDINNKETTIAFTVKALGDKGDLALIYAGKSDDGVSSLICRLNSKCRKEYLKVAIDSFINAAYAFSVEQSKYSDSADKPIDNNDNSSSDLNPSTDLNDIPVQYRDSKSKVTAWLKQQGYENSIVTIKAQIHDVADSRLIFKHKYNTTDDSYFLFDVEPVKYSPLDYNKGESYLIKGKMTMSPLSIRPFDISGLLYPSQNNS